MRNLKGRFSLLILIAVALFSGACGTGKKAQRERVYLQNIDSGSLAAVQVKEAVIQKGDLLAIKVFSDGVAATSVYNQQGIGTASPGLVITPTQAGSGYLVNQHGDIQFPTLGMLHIEGMTKIGLEKMISDTLSPFLTHGYVDVRFLNFKVTVVGEVAKPGSYTVPEERLNVLDLIGLAGDLTIFGKRDNILVIRQNGEKREFGRLDIRDAKIFSSPYFNLQQNDIVVVEPNPKKPSVNDQVLTKNLTLASSLAGVLSTIAILISIFRK